MSDPLIFLILLFRPDRLLISQKNGAGCKMLSRNGGISALGSLEDIFYLHFNY